MSAMDIEFERIDINPCPISDGNPEPNYFAGTARCKATTMVRIIYNVFILNLLKKNICKHTTHLMQYISMQKKIIKLLINIPIIKTVFSSLREQAYFRNVILDCVPILHFNSTQVFIFKQKI